MSMSDTLGDMLTRIRNGQTTNKKVVDAPASRFRKNVLEVLKREGFIDGDFKDNNYENLTLSLKGQMAANIHETHSLATAETLFENYW